ncbi:MAG: DUF58 domain-containing protein [Bernardetiaceae bacterium]
MALKDIIRELRRYEIKIRQAVNTQMHGDFHSVFKGSGLEFDDVRQYQYGDDVRAINWNVTAKGEGTYLNTYKEEKEQNVFFLLDVSASQEIGKTGAQKLDVAKKICGILMLSALREDSSVGFLAFSDTKERYIRPNKGLKHGYRIIERMFYLETKSKRTDLSQALALTLSMLKRRSVVILISDFIDEDYEKNLRALGRRHDTVVIHIQDPREARFPALGIVPLLDKESGKTVWRNTSSSEFRRQMEQRFEGTAQGLSTLCKRNNISYLHLRTDEDYAGALLKLFRVRAAQSGRKR